MNRWSTRLWVNGGVKAQMYSTNSRYLLLTMKPSATNCPMLVTMFTSEWLLWNFCKGCNVFTKHNDNFQNDDLLRSQEEFVDAEFLHNYQLIEPSKTSNDGGEFVDYLRNFEARKWWKQNEELNSSIFFLRLMKIKTSAEKKSKRKENKCFFPEGAIRYELQ